MHGSSGTSRRHLLGLALAGGGAVAAAGLTRPGSVSAADGGSVIIGATNVGSSTTFLHTTVDNRALSVRNLSQGSAAGGVAAFVATPSEDLPGSIAVFGRNGRQNGTALQGETLATGGVAIRASAQGQGVVGVSVESSYAGVASIAPFAVVGTGQAAVGSPPADIAALAPGGPPDNTGVFASSQNGEGFGVFAVTQTGVAVVGSSTGPGTAVSANADAGTAVIAQTVTGTALAAIATGTGLALRVSGRAAHSGPATFASSVQAASFAGSGAGLTALNAANVATGVLDPARVPGLPASRITSGRLPLARLSRTVARRNAKIAPFAGRVSAKEFSGPRGNPPAFRGAGSVTIAAGRAIARVKAPGLTDKSQVLALLQGSAGPGRMVARIERVQGGFRVRLNRPATAAARIGYFVVQSPA